MDLSIESSVTRGRQSLSINRVPITGGTTSLLRMQKGKRLFRHMRFLRCFRARREAAIGLSRFVVNHVVLQLHPKFRTYANENVRATQDHRTHQGGRGTKWRPAKQRTYPWDRKFVRRTSVGSSVGRPSHYPSEGTDLSSNDV